VALGKPQGRRRCRTDVLQVRDLLQHRHGGTTHIQPWIVEQCSQGGTPATTRGQAAASVAWPSLETKENFQEISDLSTPTSFVVPSQAPSASCIKSGQDACPSDPGTPGGPQAGCKRGAG
jgi:hypothetical protein